MTAAGKSLSAEGISQYKIAAPMMCALRFTTRCFPSAASHFRGVSAFYTIPRLTTDPTACPAKDFRPHPPPRHANHLFLIHQGLRRSIFAAFFLGRRLEIRLSRSYSVGFTRSAVSDFVQRCLNFRQHGLRRRLARFRDLFGGSEVGEVERRGVGFNHLICKTHL